MTWLNQLGATTAVQVLNALLTKLGVMHVSSIDNPAMTDAAIAWQALQKRWAQELSRGWYCCNRRDRVTADWQGSYLGIQNAVRIANTVRLPGDPPWPPITSRPLNPQFGQMVWRLDTNSSTFALEERGILLDVMMGVPIQEAPAELQDYVIEVVAAELAPSFGIQPNPASAVAALRNLQRLEADVKPSPNTNTDSEETLATWWRR
jgi:hypothetical protein